MSQETSERMDFVPRPHHETELTDHDTRLVARVLTNSASFEELQEGMKKKGVDETKLRLFSQDPQNLPLFFYVWASNLAEYSYPLGVVGSYIKEVPPSIESQFKIKRINHNIRIALTDPRSTPTNDDTDKRFLTALYHGAFSATPDLTAITKFFGENSMLITQFLLSEGGLLVPNNFYEDLQGGLLGPARSNLVNKGLRRAEMSGNSTFRLIKPVDRTVENMIQGFTKLRERPEEMGHLLRHAAMPDGIINFVQSANLEESTLMGFALRIVQKTNQQLQRRQFYDEKGRRYQAYALRPREEVRKDMPLPVALYVQNYGRVTYHDA